MKVLMGNRNLQRVLSVGPVRRFIENSGRSSVFAKLYEDWAGLAKTYPTMQAANDAIARARPETRGHLESELITTNFSLSAETRMSDYPALFWMLEICRKEDLRILDFGGGTGQTFVNFSRYLPGERMARWMIQDLPEVVSRAGRFFPSGVPEGLGFITNLREAPESNIFFAAGALHYWDQPMRGLFEELGHRPVHFLVNRSPMMEDGQDYYTVQQGDQWAVACRVRSFGRLKSEMAGEGYEFVDGWTDPVKSLVLPWLPSFSCPYRGAYFRKVSG